MSCAFSVRFNVPFTNDPDVKGINVLFWKNPIDAFCPVVSFNSII